MKFTLPQNPKIYITIAIIAGVIWGALRPNLMEDTGLAGLITNLHRFADGFAPNQISVQNWANSLLRNGHVLLLIWACAAVPKLFWAAYLLIYLRAMTATFSITLLIHAFGARGVLMAMALNLPQNALILGVCAITICHIKKSEQIKPAKPVIIGILAAITASAYEIFMAPWLFNAAIASLTRNPII
ncbi:MAG: hypothetical protein FWE21_07315 [Defluviitaleaceae bacterium]|nr:hypothetical protein [Defluviitaleaceae bacterium]